MRSKLAASALILMATQSAFGLNLSNRLCRMIPGEDPFTILRKVEKQRYMWTNADFSMQATTTGFLLNFTPDQAVSAAQQLYGVYPTSQVPADLLKIATLSGHSISQTLATYNEARHAYSMVASSTMLTDMAKAALFSGRPMAEIVAIQNRILTAHKARYHVPLWRGSEDPGTLLVASVLLGQTPETVDATYARLNQLIPVSPPNESISELTMAALFSGRSPEEIAGLFRLAIQQFPVRAPNDSITELIKAHVYSGRAFADVLADYRFIRYHHNKILNPDISVSEVVQKAAILHEPVGSFMDRVKQNSKHQMMWASIQQTVDLTVLDILQARKTIAACDAWAQSETLSRPSRELPAALAIAAKAKADAEEDRKKDD